MKTKNYSGTLSEKDAKSEVNRLVKETKQELRKLSKATQLDMLDLLEMFVGSLLERVGFIGKQE